MTEEALYDIASELTKLNETNKKILEQLEKLNTNTSNSVYAITDLSLKINNKE